MEIARLAALMTRDSDVVLSDYELPRLIAQEVLQVIKSKELDIPLIIISSHVGEEAAEHIMALGAYDFIMKSNLARLVPAIRRSLQEVENYQRYITTQTALQKSEALVQVITSSLPGVVFQFLLSGNHQASFKYLRYVR